MVYWLDLRIVKIKDFWMKQDKEKSNEQINSDNLNSKGTEVEEENYPKSYEYITSETIENLLRDAPKTSLKWLTVAIFLKWQDCSVAIIDYHGLPS